MGGGLIARDVRMLRVVNIRVLVISLLAASPALAGLPPIRTANDAALQLSMKSPDKQKAALSNLQSACRGRLRLALRDNARVLGRLKALSKSGSDAVKKAVMDSARCATPARFAPIIEIQLEGSSAAVVAYAAEAAARLEDPVVVPMLLDAFDRAIKNCMKVGIAASELDVCVWLTYAPGAALAGADEVLRQRAAKAALTAFDAPHPKMREVAVETLTATELKSHAPRLKALIARENKKGGFDKPNDAALIGRFKKRLKTLRSGK
jgi:hypothetical protein